MAGDDASFKEICDTARAFEPDRYFAALLAPRPARKTLIGLAAFAGEAGRITEAASEPILGEVRLQWWRDALTAGATGQKSGHQQADCLAAQIDELKLPLNWVLDVLDGESAVLAATLSAPPTTLDALRADLIQSQIAQFQLAALVLARTVQARELPGMQAPPLPEDRPLPQNLMAMAQAAGAACGLARLSGLVAPAAAVVPDHRAQSDDMLVQSPSGAALPPAASRFLWPAGASTARIGDEAEMQLDTARQMFAPLARPDRTAYLPLAMVEPYLQQQPDGRQAPAAAARHLLRRPWRILVAHISGRL